MKAAADRRCQVSIEGPAFILPVKSISKKKEYCFPLLAASRSFSTLTGYFARIVIIEKRAGGGHVLVEAILAVARRPVAFERAHLFTMEEESRNNRVSLLLEAEGLPTKLSESNDDVHRGS